MRILTLFFFQIYCVVLTGSEEGLIQTARQLLLDGKRSKAYEHLVNKVTGSVTDPKNIDLIKELNRLSVIFLTEDSQKLYEQGRTQFYKDEKGKLDKLFQAQKLEPQNLLILEQRAWFLIRQFKCNPAGKDIRKISQLNPYYPPLNRLQFYLSICEKKTIKECPEKLDINKGLKHKVYQLLACKDDESKEHLVQKASICKSLQATVPELPELKLWCSNEKNLGAIPSKERYNKDCENLITQPSYHRLIDIYPFVCKKQFSGL